MKQNGVVASQDPRSCPLYFDLNIWFRARKVIGSFEKRAPVYIRCVKPEPGCLGSLIPWRDFDKSRASWLTIMKKGSLQARKKALYKRFHECLSRDQNRCCVTVWYISYREGGRDFQVPQHFKRKLWEERRENEFVLFVPHAAKEQF